MRWGRFLGFCAGLALLATLAVLFTGHGIRIRRTLTPETRQFNCDYLTLSGIVTKDFTIGYYGFAGEGGTCPFIVDPDKPTITSGGSTK